MGIYPKDEFKHLPGGLVERTYNDFSGKVVTTWYQPILEIEVRETCYCCSCHYREGDDAFCRNHGYGWGERHCEMHDVGTGVGLDPETDAPFPLESVQFYRERQRWLERRYDQADPRCVGERIIDKVCSIQDPHSHWPNPAQAAADAAFDKWNEDHQYG